MPAFSARDEALAADLADGMRQTEAAEKHGLNARSIRRKLAEPAFRRLVDDLQADILRNVVRTLSVGAAEAVIVARRSLGSKNESTQLKAVQLILENIVSLGDFFELRERLRDLEASVPDRKRGRP